MKLLRSKTNVHGHNVEMPTLESVIGGVLLTELRQILDDRGAVLHMLRSDSTEFTEFGECYFSEVFPGVIKAWKRHRYQTQNLAVPVGRILIVIYDDRPNSISCGQVKAIELGRPNDYLRLQIPPGLWYGFSCVSDIPAILANCADIPHDPSESDVLPVDDPRIPYNWKN